MRNKAFESLLLILNSIISILRSQGFKVYDRDNKGFYLDKIEYDHDKDEMYFKMEEDK